MKQMNLKPTNLKQMNLKQMNLKKWTWKKENFYRATDSSLYKTRMLTKKAQEIIICKPLVLLGLVTSATTPYWITKKEEGTLPLITQKNIWSCF